MKNNGFTLIEIIAVIIIMGVIGLIGVATVSNNTEEARKSSFVNLARNFAESARSMRTDDKLPRDPKDGEVLLLRVDSLNGTDKITDYTTPYGELSLDYCYVMLVNNKNNIKYYVTILDDSMHAIYYKEYSLLDKKSVIASGDSKVDDIKSFNELTGGKKLSIDGVLYTVTLHQDKYIILKK